MGNCIMEQSAMSQSAKDVETEYLKDATYANTKPHLYNFNIAKVIKVYDGDTLHVAARIGSDIHRFKCRIKGVDCPELKNKEPGAIEARDFTINLCMNKIVEVNIHSDKEKYGRLLVDIIVDGKNLGEELIKNKLAKKYDL